MKRYRITYVNFVNRNDGEGWKDSSNGTMGMYNTLEDMQKDLEIEISHRKECYENVKVKREHDECVVTYEYKHWRNCNMAKEIVIYKLLEFDLDKYAEESV